MANVIVTSHQEESPSNQKKHGNTLSSKDYASLIPQERVLVVHPWMYALCEQQHLAAELLSLIEYRHREYKWDIHITSYTDLQDALVSRHSLERVGKAMRFLFEKNILVRVPHPKNKRDRSSCFKLNTITIHNFLSSYTTSFPKHGKSTSPNTENPCLYIERENKRDNINNNAVVSPERKEERTTQVVVEEDICPKAIKQPPMTDHPQPDLVPTKQQEPDWQAIAQNVNTPEENQQFLKSLQASHEQKLPQVNEEDLEKWLNDYQYLRKKIVEAERDCPQNALRGVTEDVLNPFDPDHWHEHKNRSEASLKRKMTLRHAKVVHRMCRRFKHCPQEILWFLHQSYLAEGKTMDACVGILLALGDRFMRPRGMDADVSSLDVPWWVAA